MVKSHTQFQLFVMPSRAKMAAHAWQAKTNPATRAVVHTDIPVPTVKRLNVSRSQYLLWEWQCIRILVFVLSFF